MSKIVYLDCPTGLSGDMCLGALLDVGVPLAYLQEQLQRLGIGAEFDLQAATVLRNGQRATQAQVQLAQAQADHPSPAHPNHSHHHPPARHLSEIEQLIKQADLPVRVTNWSLAIFRELAIAEGEVHGMPPEQVHFHEVGATDAIVDIVGTCLGLDWLGIDQLYCSALPTGGGSVHTAHGLLPVPVPAVLKLWQRHHVPVYSNGIAKELVTPTGAAIAVSLAQQFGPPPPMQIAKIGLGAGQHNLPLPNLLRLWLGSGSEPVPAESALGDAHQELISVLETQLDDLSPQAIGYLFEPLLAAGALDVFTQAIGMKKSRPGILLTVLCPHPAIAACEAILFRETTTLGIRRSQQQRTVLKREWQTVTTPYGSVRLKLAYYQGEIVNIQPEFADCVALAQAQQIPWRSVHQAALQAYQPTPKINSSTIHLS
jgi:pyridinium-3,5-bisthiocarboxylic acid mononucleotide nickel chelatase